MDYTKSTNFATKDSLPPGSALKIVRGTEIDTEFNAIATAVATKADIAAPTFTTSITTPIVKSASTLKLQTNGTTDAVIIDTAQNVGVGVTPSAWASGTYKAFQISGGGAISGSTGQVNFSQNFVGEAGGEKYIATAAASSYAQALGVHKWFNAPSGTAGNTITFTQAMTLDASGNLLVGTTSLLGASDTGTTHIAGGGASTNQPTLYLRNPASTAGRYWKVGPTNDAGFIIYNDSNTGQYQVYGATSWTASSDERLKTNLAPIENAAQKVSSLRAVTGRYKTDDENVSRSFLIAQDVQAVLPEAVDVQNNEQNTLGLRYTEVIPLLVAAIKEQQAVITALTARITALEQA
jgi:hypothetical protein